MKKLLFLICFLSFLFAFKTSAQVINYNETTSGDLGVDATTSVFTLNTAGVHTWTCNLEPTPYPGGADRFKVVVPAGFVITSYTYNLTSINGVNVNHGFDATLTSTPFTSGIGTANNSINHTFNTPKPAGTYDIETVSDFVPSNRPYIITITTVNLCSSLAVTSNTQTNIACFGGSNGAASINLPTGGTGGYTYNWTPGNPTGDGTRSVTGLTAGNWTCIVTDANSCTATRTFTLTQPTAINIATGSQTNVSCNGGSNGSATITPSGGAAPYTYLWSPSGGTVATTTGRSAGSYTVTVTDANFCTATRTFTITQPTAINTATGSQTNVSCNGGSNGSATITPSGGAAPYTYLWSPSGGIVATTTGRSAGSYIVTVTDANSCTATRAFTITQPTAINTATGSQTNVSCNGGSNGSATVTPSGGTAPYTYSWSPSGGTAATATGLSAGSYTVTVTDANLCTATRTFIVTQPTAINTATGSQTNVSCNGGSNGSATVTPTGGAAPFTYSWSPSGGTAATASGLSAGIYTVTVTDANSCTATRTFTITQPTAINTATGSQTNLAYNGGSNVRLP